MSGYPYPKIASIIPVLLLCASVASCGASVIEGRPTALPWVVVIDPGHGGRDSGAIGPGGVMEKDITLSVALELARELEERLGLKAVLTRTGDVFVPLAERTAFANGSGADIFISIHANAAKRRAAAGVETFFLSFDATDEDAMSVAEFENSALSSEEAEDAGELRDILVDLMSTASHHQSSMLAESVLMSLHKAAPTENRGVKQAPFVVLSGASMPAVLVELGFISNPAEERRLGSKDEQARLAASIADGVAGFRSSVGAAGAPFALMGVPGM
jgi:N-acetylmuramoyl-L-alanine amidase